MPWINSLLQLANIFGPENNRLSSQAKALDPNRVPICSGHSVRPSWDRQAFLIIAALIFERISCECLPEMHSTNISTNYFDALPQDVARHILYIRATLRIQQQARVYNMAHVKHPRWKTLRAQLVSNVGPAIDTLALCAQVCKEWRREPESWITEMNLDPSIGSTIVNEVIRGLWSRQPGVAR